MLIPRLESRIKRIIRYNISSKLIAEAFESDIVYHFDVHREDVEMLTFVPQPDEESCLLLIHFHRQKYRWVRIYRQELINF